MQDLSLLTDPHLPDMPTVYATEAFLKLTRICYDGRRVLGHNCRFLSGMDTYSTVQLQIKPKGMYSNQATMYSTYPELQKRWDFSLEFSSCFTGPKCFRKEKHSIECGVLTANSTTPKGA